MTTQLRDMTKYLKDWTSGLRFRDGGNQNNEREKILLIWRPEEKKQWNESLKTIRVIDFENMFFECE